MKTKITLKKPKFISIMVILSLTLCVLYGIAALFFQYRTGEELSPTLTENWYRVFGIEIGGTTIIYIVKRITSIWKIEDKINLKKKNGFEPEESDFEEDSYNTFYTSEYDDNDEPLG